MAKTKRIKLNVDLLSQDLKDKVDQMQEDGFNVSQLVRNYISNFELEKNKETATV